MSDRRYYQVGGLTVQVEADIPITDNFFAPKFREFEVAGPGRDVIVLRHHFTLPALDGDLGRPVHVGLPWTIYRRDGRWLYLGSAPGVAGPRVLKVAVFNHDHTQGDIYHDGADAFRGGGLTTLTAFATDQILLAWVLADRQACFLHSSAVEMNGQGLLFVGHSGAGKSTMMRMLADHAHGLTDDRNILRRWPDGYRVHGCWSHGQLPIVSAASAPLAALLFLEQAPENRLVPFNDRREIVHRLLACTIKPLETAAWWEKTLDLVALAAVEIPCYRLWFDKSGAVVPLLQELVNRGR